MGNKAPEQVTSIDIDNNDPEQNIVLFVNWKGDRQVPWNLASVEAKEAFVNKVREVVEDPGNHSELISQFKRPPKWDTILTNALITSLESDLRREMAGSAASAAALASAVSKGLGGRRRRRRTKKRSSKKRRTKRRRKSRKRRKGRKSRRRRRRR